MTQIVNLYGGPGTGKSTSAAFIFYLLKSKHKNVELVREYVKDWAWNKYPIASYDQFYFMGKQIRKESMLYNKVETIITDSPVMLNSYYAQKFCPEPIAKGVKEAVLAYYQQAEQDQHKHLHVFLKRSKLYNEKGRFQTEEQAKDIDVGIKDLLKELGISFVEYETDQTDLEKLVDLLG